jgi:transcriptional regulator with XRE-family HTH domain
MHKRILLIIKHSNISASEFASRIGVQPSSVSHILSGRNKPSLDFILKILTSYPEINPEWVLFGKGSMIKKSEENVKFPDEVSSTSEMTHGQTDQGKEGDEEGVMDAGQENLNNAQHITGKVTLFTNEKKTTRVVFFFNDHTFSEFTPENP